MKKSFKVTVQDQTLINAEKDGVFKNEVRNALVDVVKDEFIRKKPDYTKKRQLRRRNADREPGKKPRIGNDGQTKENNPTQSPNESAVIRTSSNEGLPAPLSKEDRPAPINTAGVINEDKSDIGKEFILPEHKENIQKKILQSQRSVPASGADVELSGKKDIPASTLYAEKLSKTPKNRSLNKIIGNAAYREAETIVAGGGSGDMGGSVRDMTGKRGLRAAKDTIVTTAVITRGIYRYGRFSAKAYGDVKKGLLTRREAGLSLLKRGGISLKGSGNSVLSHIKTDAARDIREFQGSDDLGMAALTKTKNVIIETKDTVKLAKLSARSVKKAVTGSVRAAQKAATVMRATVKKALSNPAMIKGLATVGGGILLSVLIMILPVFVITSLIPVLSLKSEDIELSKTYYYITEKDTDLTWDILHKAHEMVKVMEHGTNMPHNISNYFYYLNDDPNPIDEEDATSLMQAYTNADLMLVYFDSKYDDYQLDKILFFFGGTSVRGEIDKIHAELYQVTVKEWSEIVIVEDNSGGSGEGGGDDSSEDSGGDDTTGDDGSEDDTTVEESGGDEEGGGGGSSDSSFSTKIVYNLDVRLQTKTLESYIDENKETLLSPEEQDKYDAINEVGFYTFRNDLDSPFIGTDWWNKITSRYGWRIHPITGEKDRHDAIDIGMSGGTPIHAVMSGTASVIDSGDDGYGKHVIITDNNDNSTLYAHMDSFAVTNGQTVQTRDVIGYVGTTGSSTGNHLHIEYKLNGNRLNPSFYLYNENNN